MAYGDVKAFKRRTASDKILRDKTFNIAKNLKYDEYQRGIASMVYKFFDKKSTASGIANEPNYQLANELHKQIIRKFKNFFSKYAWVVLLKDKNGNSIVNAFQKILDKSGCKPNKIWVDKGSEFYNNSIKK